MHHEHEDNTIQMETDTTTYEREALIEKAIEALNLGHLDELRAVSDQMHEHQEMYEGDEGLAALDEQLRRVEAVISEQTPAAVAYMNPGQKET